MWCRLIKLVRDQLDEVFSLILIFFDYLKFQLVIFFTNFVFLFTFNINFSSQ